MGKYKLSIVVSIIIIIVGMFYLNDIDDVIEKKYESKRFNILSSVDNSVFDSELYSFAEKNDIELTIEHADDLEAIDMLKDDSTRYDAVWLSNSTWIYMLDNVKTSYSKSININPVVFGIKKSKALELGFVDKEVRNIDIVNAIKNKKLKYVMSSVTKTNTGLIAYLGFLNALSGSPETLTSQMLKNKNLKNDLKTLFSGVERVSGTDDFLKEMFLNSNDYEAVIATESSLIEINKTLENDNEETLYLIYPVDGVAINDSPFAYIDNSQDKVENFNKIQKFLLSKESQDKLEKLGKRTWYGGTNSDADKDSFKKEWGINTNKYLNSLKYPSKDVIAEAIAMYIDLLRKPSMTVFCLDYSGSMSGDGVEQLRDAMSFILNYDTAKNEQIQFSEQDKITIIPFSSATFDKISTNNGRKTTEMINKINSINPVGGTNLYGCAIEAYNEFKNVGNEYTKTIILMTDGASNIGSYESLAEVYDKKSGIPIYSIMFGDARKYELLDIAELTNARVFDGRTNLTAAFKEVRSYN